VKGGGSYNIMKKSTFQGIVKSTFVRMGARSSNDAIAGNVNGGIS
jgi:hypothetical protein